MDEKEQPLPPVRGSWAGQRVSVRCPYCGQLHWHSQGQDDKWQQMADCRYPRTAGPEQLAATQKLDLADSSDTLRMRDGIDASLVPA